MAQKIYSQAHRLIPMVSPRIVSHVDTLVQPENLLISAGNLHQRWATKPVHETATKPRNSVPETP